MPYEEDKIIRDELETAFQELELAIMTPKQKMKKILKEIRKIASI